MAAPRAHHSGNEGRARPKEHERRNDRRAKLPVRWPIFRMYCDDERFWATSAGPACKGRRLGFGRRCGAFRRVAAHWPRRPALTKRNWGRTPFSSSSALGIALSVRKDFAAYSSSRSFCYRSLCRRSRCWSTSVTDIGRPVTSRRSNCRSAMSDVTRCSLGCSLARTGTIRGLRSSTSSQCHTGYSEAARYPSTSARSSLTPAQSAQWRGWRAGAVACRSCCARS